jgi:hypothetical protein
MLIGTLTNDAGGRYRGQFTWPSNWQSITARSSLGGSATRTVNPQVAGERPAPIYSTLIAPTMPRSR